jgi:hypothetical protein
MAMRQAIIATFIRATSTKPARVRATCADGSVALAWDWSLHELNYAVAAQSLAHKMRWAGTWCGGSLPRQPSYVFVKDGDTAFTIFES